MPIIDLEVDARAWLALKASTDMEPVPLTSGEVGIILNDNLRLEVWDTETHYDVGDRVIPTNDNRIGRQFVCLSTGVSGTEEPDWAAAIRRVLTVEDGEALGNDASSSQAISDGEVLWADDGKCGDVWALEDAAHDCWKAKAAKAYDLHSMNRGGNTYDFEAIHRHCLDMASRFGGAFIK